MRQPFPIALLTISMIQAASAQAPVDGLAWMAGCWRQEAAGRVADEMWMSPAGGSMLGVNRTVASGRTVSWEFMRIDHDGGRLVFTAKPSGQAEASFPLA